MPRKKRIFENQRLFTPRVIRRFTQSSGILRNQTKGSLSGSKPEVVTGSFRFDPPGSPLKSSQQLPFDFSKFENHTFFSSAEANVNIAFEKIINTFPFDGTREEYDKWVDELTGFENHVMSTYPQYTGYLTLSGTDYIEVIDKAGVVFPSISRNSTGETILNPKTNPIFIEVDVALPVEANDDQYIFYHMSSSIGYAAYVENTASTTSAKVYFTILSGSRSIAASTRIVKGRFNKLAFFYDNRPFTRRAGIMSGTTVVSQSPRFTIGSINTGGSSLFIASGSAFSSPHISFTPSSGLTGSLNNFRVFHEIRTAAQITNYETRTLFSEENARLAFRFNEPTGSYTNEDVVLDHSGNSLHSKISNYQSRIRGAKPYPSLVRFERAVFHPTLFPSHPDVLALNTTLLTTASQYDSNNPNLITNLVPRHYLEVAAQSNYAIGTSADGELLEGIKAQPSKYSLPGAAAIGQPQIISALLFMWARAFDEMKIMLDHVSNLVHVDYEKEDSIADQFLPFLSKYYGFELPNMFRNADYGQFFSGENVSGETMVGSLNDLQNEMWRRILINLKEVLASKGTIHSIKTLFRSAGIDPDRMFRFIEYGGPSNFRLGQSRKKITEISTMIDFSGSLSAFPGVTNAQGFYEKRPYLQSTYLSASRKEVGFPAIAGTFVKKTIFPPHGISNDPNDGLLTSGSWTAEGRFKFPITRDYNSPQSLFRLHTTQSVNAHHRTILNVVADPDRANQGENPSVTMYCRPGSGASAPLLALALTGANIFDGGKWYVSVGRTRNDRIGLTLSSSYFINVARQDYGNLAEFHTTSSLFQESATVSENLFQRKVLSSVSQNLSGSFIVIGEQSLDTSAGLFLNDSSLTSRAQSTKFAGLAGHLRFWSNDMTNAEAREHARSFQSLGVINPLKNFGFTPDVTGSFGKLRLDLSTDQPVTQSNSTGRLEMVDFSQQFITGSYLAGFEISKSIIKPERFDYSIIAPNYDEISEDNKVRVSGFTEGDNLKNIGGLPAPIYEIAKAHEPQDDSRFSIEFSMMQALNEDIIKIFATLDSLDDILGAPELMFAEEYPGLRDLREVYFNRLTGTVNYKNFFDFFRWLDSSFDVMIERLIPRKTNYLGFNFIIEQHALERAKVAYGSGDVYLGPSERRNLKGIILLRQLIAQVRKI